MRILMPLADRRVALLWTGLALSAVGDQLYAVALTWLAVSLAGAQAGYLGALQGGATLSVAALGGIWADRWDHRRTMIAADLLRAAAVLVLVASALGAAPGMAVLVVTAATVAGLQAFFRPALQASLPRLAGRVDLLPATNALFDATERLARLGGPLIVGALSGLLPIVHFFTLDAVSFLASAAAVAALGRLLPRRSAERASPAAAPPPGGGRIPWTRPLRQSLGRGLAALRPLPLLRYVLATTLLLNGGWYVTFFLALPLLIDESRLAGLGGTGLGAFGLVMAAYGTTNLAANLVVGSLPLRRPGRLIFLGVLMMGAGIALLGLAAALAPRPLLLPLLMAAAALAAIGGPCQDIPVSTLRQTRCAPHDVAAVVRLYMMGNHGGTLLAMSAAPALIAAFGTTPLLIGTGLAILAAGVLGLARFGGAADAGLGAGPGAGLSAAAPGTRAAPARGAAPADRAR